MSSGAYVMSAVLFGAAGFTAVLNKDFNLNKNLQNNRDEWEERAIDSATAQLNYAKNNGMTQKYIIVIDYSIPCYYKRMFVVQMRNKTIVRSNLVAHGEGGGSTATYTATSNVSGSFCSSIGRYKTGDKYAGKFGTSVKLHGLDKTNSNALSRGIVLHAFDGMPENESANYVCFSQGCPMLNQEDFDDVISNLNLADKPILVYAYK